MTWPGLYSGLCSNNNDPANRYRVRLLIPQVLQENESEWARPCVMPGWPDLAINSGAHAQTSGTGVHSHAALFPVPRIGDAVWVMFEGGDPTKPVWMGVWVHG
jgi:hypothetical protein